MFIRSFVKSVAFTTIFGASFALSGVANAGPCHHCPPEPTIGGVPQPTDDVLMQNGVNWAEKRAANDRAIMAYDGWDPAVRFAQFIIWFANVAGPNIPQSHQTDAQEPDGELVLGEGRDGVLGTHKVVVPIFKQGFILNGQRAYVETSRGRIWLRVVTPKTKVKGYGGYLMLVSEDRQQDIAFGIPYGDDDLEWVYPLVRVSLTKADGRNAALYSEKGRGIRKAK